MNDTAPIGFAGLGNMGAPMARCLAEAGWRLRLYDVRPEACAPFAGGAPDIETAQDLADLGAGAEMVITMLPDSDAVEQAVWGGDAGAGLADGLTSGSLIVDMSSCYAPRTRVLGAALAERGITLVDAPVSGGVPRAVDGTLAIMAGGEQEDVDRAAPALAAMGTVYRTGGLGTGHAMKALNNYLSFVGLAAASEALLIGQRFGLDGAVMTDIFNAATGRNRATENKLKQHVLNGRFAAGFTLGLMDKDLRMAAALADDLGVPAPGLAATGDLLSKATEALGGEADHTTFIRYLEALQAPEEAT